MSAYNLQGKELEGVIVQGTYTDGEGVGCYPGVFAVGLDTSDSECAWLRIENLHGLGQFDRIPLHSLQSAIRKLLLEEEKIVEKPKLPDIDYAELDFGIRRAVMLCRTAGFDTTDSGDGRSKDPQEHDVLSEPHVAIRTSPATMIQDADRLRLVFAKAIEMKDSPVRIQASYDPADGSAVIVMTGLDDTLIARECTTCGYTPCACDQA